jgi:hypothetical protein
MKIDGHWRGWGISHDPRYWSRFFTPLGSFGVDSFREQDEPGLSRGRCREWEFRIPLTRKWQINLSTNGKDYLTLVKGPKYLKNLNWILDEFDSSFNDLAIASLRYHLDFSVCDTSAQRDVYEDLIARLGEAPPEFTDEEMAVLHPPGWRRSDDFEERDGHIYLKESTPEEKAIYEAHWKLEDEYHARINQARHDFVDIIGNLWS